MKYADYLKYLAYYRITPSDLSFSDWRELMVAERYFAATVRAGERSAK